jgi:hypothetical protein
MSVFKEYEKVQRIEKEECDGLLEGTCYIYEKIDGANSQLYIDDVSCNIAFCSRNRIIGIGSQLLLGDDFRGFGKWVGENIQEIREFLEKFPELTLYGEWLVPHSVKYSPEFYNNFYCFDIMDNNTLNSFIHPNDPLWNKLPSCIKKIPFDCVIKDVKIDDLKQYLSLPSSFGAAFREGIVIKNYNFVNKYGRTPYGKLLSKDFQEVKSKPKSKTINPEDLEFEIAKTYCTKARVVKICEKIKDRGIIVKDGNRERVEIEKLEMKHIPQVINMVWYDIITEDMNDILKRFNYPTINFKKFKAIILDMSKTIFINYLEE